MTVSVITGTLQDIRDPKGKLYLMRKAGFFRRRYWDGAGWRISSEDDIDGFDNYRPYIGEIDQTTGCAKTLLAAIHAYNYYRKGLKSCGNFSMGWTENNRGVEPKKWRPILNSLTDVVHAPYFFNVIDDVSSTIEKWNTEEAEVMKEIANATRKRGKRIEFTTQRMVFVPPSIRDILEWIYVPFIFRFDTTKRAPDGRWMPLTLLVMKFSPAHKFKGYEWIHLAHPYYQYILQNFNTLEIATGLKEGAEEQPPNYQPGAKLETEAFEFLKTNIPGEWRHLNGKHVFDIVSEKYAIDVCGGGLDDDGCLITDHKTLTGHMHTAKLKRQKPLLMFQYQDSWGFIRITPYICENATGTRLSLRKTRIYSPADVFSKADSANQSPQVL